MKPIKKEMWKCPDCNKAFNTEREADLCLYAHIRERCINHDFKHGHSLDYIKFEYCFHWDLTETQKRITKHNCFTISYLQCCKKPAYKITKISNNGEITVTGKGSWSGYYSSVVRLDCLSDPKHESELYIDER